MTIQQKVGELLKLRTQIDELKKTLDPLKTQRDELQENIIAHMKKQGFNSVKTDEATVSKQISKKIVIESEDKLVADLKKRGLDEMVKERLNGELWTPFSREIIKQGEKFDGIEIVETEFISVRKSKPKTEGGGDDE
jgi:hypothetical protein